MQIFANNRCIECMCILQCAWTWFFPTWIFSFCIIQGKSEIGLIIHEFMQCDNNISFEVFSCTENWLLKQMYDSMFRGMSVVASSNALYKYTICFIRLFIRVIIFFSAIFRCDLWYMRCDAICIVYYIVLPSIAHINACNTNTKLTAIRFPISNPCVRHFTLSQTLCFSHSPRVIMFICGRIYESLILNVSLPMIYNMYI